VSVRTRVVGRAERGGTVGTPASWADVGGAGQVPGTGTFAQTLQPSCLARRGPVLVQGCRALPERRHVVTEKFEHHWSSVAEPFDWRFTRDDLERPLARLSVHEPELQQAA
jgi:hypothetical protein